MTMIKRRLPFVLLILMVVVLATATVIEKYYGTSVAQEEIYRSTPFALLWGAIGLSGLTYLLSRRPVRRPPILLLHIALLVILLGGALTLVLGEQGRMELLPGGTPEQVYYDEHGGIHPLPYSLTLESFTIDYYSGTGYPSDYRSEVTITEGRHKTTGIISMNHILSHRGYRFYQTGYDAEGGGTILSVSHDPWGIGVTYSGYLLLLVSMIWLLLEPQGHFRRLLKRRQSRLPVLLLPLLFYGTLAQAETTTQRPPSIPGETAERMGRLFIRYNDRICPLDTYARDFTTKLYGKSSYRGYSAEQVMAGWLFYFDYWRKEPMIRVKGASVKEALGMHKGQYASLDSFYGAEGYRLDSLLRIAIAGKEEMRDRSHLMEVNEKCQLIRQLASAESLTLFPLAMGDSITWKNPLMWDYPVDVDEGKVLFIHKGFNYLTELVVTEQWTEANHFLDRLLAYQTKEAGESLPPHHRIEAEMRYNQLATITRPLAMGMTTLGILLFVYLVILTSTSKESPRWIRRGLALLTALPLLYLTALLLLRWTASGHVPLANGHETMSFLAWITLLLALAVRHRSSSLYPYGLLIAGLSLLVASFGESNPQLSPLMPVLQSPLLSIHVVVIMTAYSLLAFTMLNGCMALLLRRRGDLMTDLRDRSLLLLYPALCLLALGIFIGAVWANVSWGTYWSWDPKEVWALITLLLYSLPLHRESLPLLQRPRAFHLYMVIAFLSVLITYFGVNFFLGGMHSYA